LRGADEIFSIRLRRPLDALRKLKRTLDCNGSGKLWTIKLAEKRQ
jgi:hypothetical protein